MGTNKSTSKPKVVQPPLPKDAKSSDGDDFSDDDKNDKINQQPAKQPVVVRKNKDPSPEASEVFDEEPVDEEFEVNEVEDATQSMPPPAQAKPAPKVTQKSPVAQVESSGTAVVEESIPDEDFVEESIQQDEKVEAVQES